MITVQEARERTIKAMIEHNLVDDCLALRKFMIESMDKAIENRMTSVTINIQDISKLDIKDPREMFKLAVLIFRSKGFEVKVHESDWYGDYIVAKW